MKKILVLLAMVLMMINTNAKEKKKNISEVIFKVEMDCQGCVKKIEKNIAFEKGVKGLTVVLEEQKVKVSYRDDKTDKEKLKKAFEKLGYKAVEWKDEEKNTVESVDAHHNHKH